MIDIEQEIKDTLIREIARELMLEKYPEVDHTVLDTILDEILPMCRGNPFDAPILYGIIKIAKEIKLREGAE